MTLSLYVNMLNNIIKSVLSIMLVLPGAWASKPPDTQLSKATDCSDPGPETPLASTIGSAHLIHNLAQHPESIRMIAGRLLEDALNGEHGKLRDCAPNCTSVGSAEVVYRVAPTEFLAPEDQHAVCLAFESETTDNPLRFDSRAFDTMDEMNDWIMEFSQGQGEDGKRLYQQCSSNCSPRYTFLIAGQRTGYEVKTEVLCGLARDRSNNRYHISTSLRRRCVVN